MLKKIKVNSSIFVLFLLLSLYSCDNKRVFDEYQSLDTGNWGKDNHISFSFAVTDTLAKRNLFINLRNNNSYEFSNLFLITKMLFPDGQRIIDTLEYDMTDGAGHFLGTGFTQVKENKLFYKEHIAFPVKGIYQISIEQAMRKNGEVNGVTSLKGITELGFRIEKTN